MRQPSPSLEGTYFVQDGFDDIIKDHGLICSLGEDTVEVVRFVAQRIGTHGKLHLISHYTIRANDHRAILLDLAGTATSASDDNIDVSFLAELRVEVALLAFQPRGGYGRVG